MHNFMGDSFRACLNESTNKQELFAHSSFCTLWPLFSDGFILGSVAFNRRIFPVPSDSAPEISLYYLGCFFCFFFVNDLSFGILAQQIYAGAMSRWILNQIHRLVLQYLNAHKSPRKHEICRKQLRHIMRIQTFWQLFFDFNNFHFRKESHLVLYSRFLSLN